MTFSEQRFLAIHCRFPHNYSPIKGNVMRTLLPRARVFEMNQRNSPWGLLPALLLLALPVVAQAQFVCATNSDGLTLAITGYTGSGGALAIPTNINGLTVTSIGDYAVKECSSLTSVTIPGTVTAIGMAAFW